MITACTMDKYRFKDGFGESKQWDMMRSIMHVALDEIRLMYMSVWSQ